MSQLLGVFILVALACGLIYVLFHPQWVVLLVIVMFPLEQLLQVYFPFFSQYASLLNYMVGFMTLLVVLAAFVRGKSPAAGYKNPATIAIGLLFLLVFATLVYSPGRNFALNVLFPRGIAYCGLYLILLPLVIPGIREFRSILVGLLLVGGLMSMFIVLNPNATLKAGRLVFEVGAYAGQMRSNPLALASMGGQIAVVAVLMQSDRRQWLLFILRAVAFLFGIGLALQTGSRGQVLAAVATAAVCFPLARRLKNPTQFLFALAGSAVVMAGFYVAFKVFVSHEQVSRWDVGGFLNALEGRFSLVAILIKSYLANPHLWITGLGTSAFFHYSGGGFYPHNMIVQVLCEHGIVGLTLVGVAAWYAVKSGWRLWSVHRDDVVIRSSIAILVALCMYEFLLSLKQGSFIQTGLPFAWWLVLSKLATRELAVMEGDEVDEWAAFDSSVAGEYATDLPDHGVDDRDGGLDPGLAMPSS